MPVGECEAQRNRGMGKVKPIKREGTARLDARLVTSLRKMQKALEECHENYKALKRDMEVVRMVWEMRHAGHGPTEISRRLKQGPPWQWRTVAEVRKLAEPGVWRLRDGGLNERQG